MQVWTLSLFTSPLCLHFEEFTTVCLVARLTMALARWKQVRWESITNLPPLLLGSMQIEWGLGGQRSSLIVQSTASFSTLEMRKGGQVRLTNLLTTTKLASSRGVLRARQSQSV